MFVIQCGHYVQALSEIRASFHAIPDLTLIVGFDISMYIFWNSTHHTNVGFFFIYWKILNWPRNFVMEPNICILINIWDVTYTSSTHKHLIHPKLAI